MVGTAGGMKYKKLRFKEGRDMNKYEKAKEYFEKVLNSAAKSGSDYGVNQTGCSEINTAIEALEKQIPKTPQKSGNSTFHICPTCSKFIKQREQSHGNISIPCCKWCGQKLDWDGVDNGKKTG